MRREAEIAAKWWADQLRGIAKLDVGAKPNEALGSAAFVAMSTILQIEDHAKVQDSQIAKFQSILCEAIDGVLSRRPSLILDVDYGPDQMLGDALRSVECTGFAPLPWKTTMWIGPESVTVSCGYQAPTEQLYTPE